jgi:hypothetical protein
MPKIKKEPENDVIVENLGTIWRFYLKTNAAKEWVARHADAPSWAWIGSFCFSADHRMSPNLVEGMREAGLVCSGTFRE